MTEPKKPIVTWQVFAEYHTESGHHIVDTFQVRHDPRQETDAESVHHLSKRLVGESFKIE